METPVFSAKSASRAAPPEVTPGDQQVTSSEEQQAYRMEVRFKLFYKCLTRLSVLCRRQRSVRIAQYPPQKLLAVKATS